MATFATIPHDFISGGWLKDVSDAGYKLFARSLVLPLREDRVILHCCVQLHLRRGEWLMSRNDMQKAVEISNDRTFDRALDELGPVPGVGFLVWRPACEHRGRNSKTVWGITRPDLFVRTAADVEAEKQNGTGLSGWLPTATNTTAVLATNGHQYHGGIGYQRPPFHTRARTGAGVGEGKGRAAAHAHDLRETQPEPSAPPLSDAAVSFSSLEDAATRKWDALDLAPADHETLRDQRLSELAAIAEAHGETIPNHLKRGRNGAA